MHAFPISAGNLFVVMKAKPIPGTESMLEAQGHPLDIYIYQNDGGRIRKSHEMAQSELPW